MVATADVSGLGERPSATRTQHAIRLLVLLAECGDPINGEGPPGAVTVIRSELRLQAMDFWMRNPDYLADELVGMVENGKIDDSFLAAAQALLDDPEPDLHWYPMPRWFFGAYEQLDDAFTLLETYGLASLTRVGEPGKKSQRNQFYLTQAGANAAAELASDPVLGWYGKQVRLVALVAGTDVGKRLKERQYEQATYAGTELGLTIAPIASRVRERLHGLQATTTNLESKSGTGQSGL